MHPTRLPHCTQYSTDIQLDIKQLVGLTSIFFVTTPEYTKNAMAKILVRAHPGIDVGMPERQKADKVRRARSLVKLKPRTGASIRKNRRYNNPRQARVQDDFALNIRIKTKSSNYLSNRRTSIALFVPIAAFVLASNFTPCMKLAPSAKVCQG